MSAPVGDADRGRSVRIIRTRIMLMAGAFAGTLLLASAAQAQFDTATSFRGCRVEGQAGGDRFQSQGNHDDKFGFGGAVGFDGQIATRS